MIIKKSGFTLVELVVVIAIFGVLVIVAANYLIATVSTSSRIAAENEVRQNASFVMADIEREIRKAACVDFSSDTNTSTLAISYESCGSTADVTYTVANGILKKNGEVMGANSKVVFVDCGDSACSGSSVADCAPGLSVDPPGETTNGVEVTLNVRQFKPTTRQDGCAKITLSETVTPRNGGN